jgi:hypothetical protein
VKGLYNENYNTLTEETGEDTKEGKPQKFRDWKI